MVRAPGEHERARWRLRQYPELGDARWAYFFFQM